MQNGQGGLSERAAVLLGVAAAQVLDRNLLEKER